MDNHFKRVTDAESFKELLTRSKKHPVVIFKHSMTCPISASVYNEMTQYDGDVALLEVQKARELSREVENKTGVRHETPQVLVLRNGQAVWSASHWNVTAEAVRQAVRDSE
jgi:bacillithiol system protein YtxJ